MLFMIQCFEKENGLEIRKATREAHLAYASSAGARLKFAGPMLASEEDATPIGSLILLDAASEAAAYLYADNDPYNTAGLFEKILIKPMLGVLGQWLEDHDN